MTITGKDPRRWLRSTAALAFGLVVVVGLSLATDQVLHVLKVYPPWGQPMYDAGLCLLALSYRIVYSIVGGYVAARYAPRAPMGHALALGIVGLVVGGAGTIATIPMHLGPAWYSIAVAFTALPGAWLGGALQRVRRTGRTTRCRKITVLSR